MIFMEASIKLKPEELNSGIISKIREMIGERNNVEVTIIVREKTDEYLSTLNHSIHDLETNKGLISFTIEEFLNYPSKKTLQ